MIEERIQAAKQYVKTLFADRADGHDMEHTLRVYTNAMRIAQVEGPCDLEIVGLSALLHDADDDKLFQTENNANARMFLEEIGIPQDRKSNRFVGLSMLFLSAKIVGNIQKP